MHGVRGASGGVPARGPGFSPDLCPPRAPRPLFSPPGNTPRRREVRTRRRSSTGSCGSSRSARRPGGAARPGDPAVPRTAPLCRSISIAHPERWPATENPATHSQWVALAARRGRPPSQTQEEALRPGRRDPAPGPGPQGCSWGSCGTWGACGSANAGRRSLEPERGPRHGGGPGVCGRGGAGPGVRGRWGRGAGLVPGRGGRGPGTGAAGARGPQHGRRAGGAARGHRGGPGGGRGAVRTGRAGVQPRAGVPGLREEVRREHGAVQRLRGEPGGGARVQVGEPLRRVRARGRAGALRRAANIGACAP